MRIEVDRHYFLTKSRSFLWYPTKKRPVYFFDTDAEKSVPNWKIRFPQRKNKRRWNIFGSKTEATVNLRLENSVKEVEKSSYIQKNRHSVPSSSSVFVGVKIVRLFFLLSTNTFCLFRCIESFPYCSISESGCLKFQLISFLWHLDSVCQWLGSYGGHLLVVDCEMSGTHNLRTLSLRHKDSCIHHMQTLFLEGNIVRQLYLLFCSFE